MSGVTQLISTKVIIRTALGLVLFPLPHAVNHHYFFFLQKDSEDYTGKELPSMGFRVKTDISLKPILTTDQLWFVGQVINFSEPQLRDWE